MMKDNKFIYIGNELEIFSQAKNWKRYVSKKVSPFIKGDVLEIGAGTGENIKYLINNNVKSWTSIEPDHNLYLKIPEFSSDFIIHKKNCFLNDIYEKYDTIIYFDVLEHIEEDMKELYNARNILRNNGILLIISPAHNFLYTKFDKEIGHYRRYNKKMLNKLTYNYYKIKLFYIDSLGFFLSLANIFLKKNIPTKYQILFWDRVIVPLSCIADRIFFYKFGKTICGIFKK